MTEHTILQKDTKRRITQIKLRTVPGLDCRSIENGHIITRCRSVISFTRWRYITQHNQTVTANKSN